MIDFEGGSFRCLTIARAARAVYAYVCGAILESRFSLEEVW